MEKTQRQCLRSSTADRGLDAQCPGIQDINRREQKGTHYLVVMTTQLGWTDD